MIVTPLFSAQKIDISNKPAAPKPIRKNYRELLQLDRPRRKIEYESSEEEEDFLEKLMNEERNKSRKKKRSTSRKNSSQNETRAKGDKAQLLLK